MNTVQNPCWGKWRHALGLLIVLAVSVLFAGSGLLAGSPNTTQRGLQEGTFVPRDTTKKGPSAIAQAALQRLNQSSTRGWRVSWDEFTGLPRSMRGLTKKEYAGDPTQAAQAFAEGYKDLFAGINAPQVLADYSLEVLRVTPQRNYTTVAFRWYYKGARVYHSSLGIDILPSGAIANVFNSLRPTSLDDATPELSQTEIESLIRKASYPDSVVSNGRTMELCIYPSAPPRLAYAGFKIIGGSTMEFIVDAHTGEFISVIPLFVSEWPGIRRMGGPDTVRPDSSAKKKGNKSLMNLGPVFQVPGRDTTKEDGRIKPDTTRFSPPPDNKEQTHPDHRSPVVSRWLVCDLSVHASPSRLAYNIVVRRWWSR